MKTDTPSSTSRILLRQLINLALMIPSLFQSYWNSNHPSNIFCKQFFPQPQLISRADPSIPQLMHSTLLRMELSKLLLVCVWIRFILLKILKIIFQLLFTFKITVHWPICTVHGSLMNSARGAELKKKKKKAETQNA